MTIRDPEHRARARDRPLDFGPSLASGKERPRRAFCSATATTLSAACRSGLHDDLLVARTIQDGDQVKFPQGPIRYPAAIVV